MDDFMLIEYLRNKGIDKNMSEQEFIDKFKEFVSEDNVNHNTHHHGKDNYSMSDKMYDDSHIRGHNHSGEFNEMFDSNSEDQHRLFDKFNRMVKGMDEEDMYEMMRTVENRNTTGNEHFNDSYARYLVSTMYHFENGRKYIGEKFDMTKAKEVCERYRGTIPQTVTYADVYVAINAQYHDYCDLFRSWFGDGIEQKNN